MSQTLDCEFVGKHFTTLCLHRAVGDPTSHYSALWSPEQIWWGWQEGERETECIFDLESWGKFRKLCFGILKLDHQIYSFSHQPQEWERLAVTGGDRKLTVPGHSSVQGEGDWDMMLIMTSVNDICFSVNNSLGLPSSWQWLLWTTHQPHWNYEVALHSPSSLLGHLSSGSDQQGALLCLITGLDLRRSRGWGWPKRCAMFLMFEKQAWETKAVLQVFMGLEKRERGGHQQP